MKLWFMVSGKVRVLNENNLLLPSETLRHRTTPPSVRLSNSCRTEDKMSIVWLCYLKVWSSGRERRGINCQSDGMLTKFRNYKDCLQIRPSCFCFSDVWRWVGGGSNLHGFFSKKICLDWFVRMFFMVFFFFCCCFFFFFFFLLLLFRGLKLRGRETIVKDEVHWGLTVSHNGLSKD